MDDRLIDCHTELIIFIEAFRGFGAIVKQNHLNFALYCHTELKRLRDLQYESDFNDNIQQSNFYKQKAEYIQNLIKKGVDSIPNF